MKVWFTIAYGMVILGSCGLMAFTTRFPFGTALSDLEHADEKALGLFDGKQVWAGSWRFIIFGTAMQLAAVWMWD